VLADLHLHSTFSDGTLDPAALAWVCRDRGLEAISVTDHDAWGQNEALAVAGLPRGLLWIPGVELSTAHEATGLGLHVLGYGLEPDRGFRRMLDELRSARQVRVRAMGGALEALGLEVDVAGILAEAGSPGKPDVARSALGRFHNAARLAADGVADVGSFIETYLEQGCPAHVPKRKVPTAAAVAAIRRCGGHAVWAHPAVDLRSLEPDARPSALERTLDELVAAGLEGVEVGNLAHSVEEVERLRAETRERGLHETAGSDFHDLEDNDTNRILSDCDQDVSWLM
jgi:3',5'-nucleoside bisphosphate phosphatase